MKFFWIHRFPSAVLIAALAMIVLAGVTFGQANDRLTPMQRQIEQQKQRLSSSDIEERRTALMKLGSMKHPDASRAAATVLNDPDPIIRVTAAHAITSMPASESVPLLVLQLKDKLEFVRREMADALGETRSRSAVQPLVELLTSDKEISVRAAAANALGEIHDESAVPALVQLLSGVPSNKKSKKREDDFVMRSAARALGEIHSRAGVQVLVATLRNETAGIDLRRTAAEALGLIGDPAAVPDLQAVLTSSDPYLASAAREALRRLRLAKN